MSLTEIPGIPQATQNNEKLQLKPLKVKTLANKLAGLLTGLSGAAATSATALCLRFICGISTFIALISPEPGTSVKIHTHPPKNKNKVKIDKLN